MSARPQVEPGRLFRGALARLNSQRGQAGFATFALTVGVLAGLYHGVPRAEVDLNDGGVWVVNVQDRAIAHLNYPSMTLDGAVVGTSQDFDLLQSGGDVLLHDLTQGVATPVDTTQMAFGNSAELDDMSIAVGGATAVVSDPTKGEVWVLPAGKVSSFSPESSPQLSKAKGVQVAVGRNGTAYAVDPAGDVVSWHRSGASWAKEERGSVGRLEGAFTVSAVGDTPVVLDLQARKVRTTSDEVDLPRAGSYVLQPAGDDASSVAVATEDSLLLAPLGGGDVQTAEGSPTAAGLPAAPVRVGSCFYAAWGGSGHYLRDCDKSSDDIQGDEPRLAGVSNATSLVFRVNRDVVVLNNVDNGDSFLINEDMALVANWDEILGQTEDQQRKKDEQQDVDKQVVPDRNGKNHPPTARDDSYGARPGRTTTLPVLDNDSDPDGDVLLAASKAEPPIGDIGEVRGGEALQIRVPTGQGRATASIPYEARDGRGKPGTAVAKVEVHPWSQNEAPERKDKDVVVVLGQRAQVKYNLLQDWIDPDGDPIFLTQARSIKGLEVTYTEDGTVTVRDLGQLKPGRYAVPVYLSDGSKSTKGQLDVELRARGNIAPVANADHATVLVGQSLVLDPLTNDTDANGDELRLSNVKPAPAGLSVKGDFGASTITLTGKQVGTYYVDYAVTDGPSIANGIIRVEVTSPLADAEPPVPDNDLALLRPGEAALADVLTNDYDPAGGVLVVQSAAAEPESGLTLDIVNHEFVRVRAQGTLSAPAVFTYTVSNGVASATAQVTVVPVPPVTTDQAPVAEDDKATVRAGDVVTIPVLANDRSPANSSLRLGPDLAVLPKNFPGQAFVSGDSVRFKAGSRAGRVRLTYTVFDSNSNFASAQVVIDVTAKNDSNSPPTPPPLTARVLSGGEVLIPVPSDGIDPDGDSVSLLGVGSAPTKGVVSVVGGALRYRAPLRASGTDRFTYVVQDAYGATASAPISVGIAAANAQNQLPTAVPDELTVRPGRKISVAVTSNDTDPDGDAPILIEGSVKAANKRTTTGAATSGSRVELTTPDGGAKDLVYTYEITDRPNGIAVQGALTVHVRPDAPKLPPIARDDVVSPLEVLGRNTVEVDVLANDEDPDGASSGLSVSVQGQGATVERGKVVVTLGERRRIVLYTVADEDGLTSSAVISVPGLQDLHPVVDPRKVPLSVTAGDRISLSVPDLVIVREGRKPSLTFGNTVATSGGGTAKATDQRTVSFAADRGYVGLTAVSFEVTDGKNADDPKGLKSVLSIPVDVKPRSDQGGENTPPTCQPTSLTVSSSEDATRADLRAMCSDPDDGDTLSFRLGSPTGGAASSVKISVSDNVLSAVAGTNARPGTSLTVPVAVTDGKSDPVRMQVPVDVVGSTRPLISVPALSINDAEVGKAATIDVADHATNPFADVGKPITVSGVRATTAEAAKVSARDTTITVTPTRSGQVLVEFVLADATGDESRNVAGTLAVTVRDRPDAPTGVTAVTQESETATVKWRPGAANGSPITGFRVQYSDGSKDCGLVTACTITGLQNQKDYTFVVVATNAVGASDPSGKSNVVRPDRKPDAPQFISADFGDRSATLKWTVPKGDFSPVKNYTVEVSPAAGVSQKQSSSNELTWTGLSNGTSYTFRVEAHNDVEDPSDWSGRSQPVVPAGKPAAPARPSVEKAPADNTQPSARVSWPTPDGNGDDNLTYELVASNGKTWKTTTTSQQVLMDASSQDVTFKVRASNKALAQSGPGDWSPPSDSVRFFRKPGTVSSLRAEPTGQDNQVRINFGSASGNGATPSEMTYHWAANGQSGVLNSGDTVTSSAAFQNGQNVSVAVWASSTVRGETADGDKQSDDVNAYGPPTQPGITQADGGYRQVRFSWNGSGTGNGRDVLETRYRTNNGGWQGAPTSGSTTVQVGPATSVVFEVQTRNEGGWGASNTASARSWDDSDYRFTRTSRKASNGLYYVNVELWRYRPNSTVSCSAGAVGNYGNWQRNFRVDGSGHWGPGDSGAGAASTWDMNNFGECHQL